MNIVLNALDKLENDKRVTDISGKITTYKESWYRIVRLKDGERIHVKMHIKNNQLETVDTFDNVVKVVYDWLKLFSR